MDQTTRGVLKVARSVLEELDIEQVLDRVLEAARELTGARYAALGVLDESRNELARFLTQGIDEDERRGSARCPPGAGCWASSSAPRASEDRRRGELIRTPTASRSAIRRWARFSASRS